METPVVTISKEIMGGTPVFAGTRVPIQTLIDYLVAGDSIDDFLEGFPTVKREQVIGFCERSRKKNGERFSDLTPELSGVGGVRSND